MSNAAGDRQTPRCPRSFRARTSAAEGGRLHHGFADERRRAWRCRIQGQELNSDPLPCLINSAGLSTYLARKSVRTTRATAYECEFVHMDIDHDLITRLIAQPTEGLNQELKRWLDPGVAVDQAKIIKASVALYNRNGGYLIIGFDDKTRQPAPGAPTDVRQTFSADRIQELISRHASDRFEIAMGFGERDGQEYPVIVVPPGVRVPVGIGRALVESGADLLKVGDIPIRTLHANGTFSTAIAGPKDWPAMLEICFDNREADIGRFIRRHLGVLAGALNASGSSDEAVASIRQRATDFLNFGWARYRQAKTRLSNPNPCRKSA